VALVEVRKIFKAGNSCVVALPIDFLKALNLKDGSHIAIEINREKKEIILKPVIVKKDNMSIDFVRMVDKILVDYDFVLRRLSERALP